MSANSQPNTLILPSVPNGDLNGVQTIFVACAYWDDAEKEYLTPHVPLSEGSVVKLARVTIRGKFSLSFMSDGTAYTLLV